MVCLKAFLGSFTWQANQVSLLTASLSPLPNGHFRRAPWRWRKWSKTRPEESCNVGRPPLWSHAPSFPQYPIRQVSPVYGGRGGLLADNHSHSLCTTITHILPICKVLRLFPQGPENCHPFIKWVPSPESHHLSQMRNKWDSSGIILLVFEYIFHLILSISELKKQVTFPLDSLTHNGRTGAC